MHGSLREVLSAEFTLPISTLNTQHFSTAWLSLDAADSEPTRFLAYLIAALQAVAPRLGAGMAAALQVPQPPPAAALLNVIAA